MFSNKRSIHSYIFFFSLNSLNSILAGKLNVGLITFNIVNDMSLRVKTAESYKALVARDAECCSRQIIQPH
jgi:hypothetical protein